MALTSKQRLALAICDFLSSSTSDGTISSDDGDSIDVAINCISEAFKIDPTDEAAITEAVGDQNLQKIYSVYEKLKNSSKSSTPTTMPESPSSTSASVPTPSGLVTEAAKKEAEGLKSKGNSAMAQKDYAGAIDLYTKALGLYPRNAIYLSNRAAAYSAAKDHESAKTDAEAAVAIDPNYTKAWSRLGLAKFALGDAKGAMEAYKKGIDYEGNGGSDAMKKGFETAKRRVEELNSDDIATASTPRGSGSTSTPDLGGLASMFGGGRGSNAAGGMPDFSSIMNNPMFSSMAQNLMSNPDLMSNLMSNPRLRDMANQFGGGGGMPDLSTLMSDPNIADMARSMMGGAGRGASGGSNE
ncbi:hsc70 cochaperone [Grosmannia clavigera kw1407]|uniref:Hsc70 cochaperone n=1 Tax=Grosmannia clavigera (strain kw1407 / UAMH 11150) TaxID=655863 RepID=F0XL49_GROCL|nr:hsc70 cochaperone [Grosmannia clavigera kw1407]EFX01647.1 hsc70 cochaperone [Grosmannia clavigera kw1407]